MLLGETYDLIGDIVPHASSPVRAPLRGTADIPTQQWVRGSRFSRDPSRLQLREVGFEEANLVFSIYAGRVGIRPHDAEVVPYFARVDGCRCLRNQLCPPHVLAIPVGSAVKGKLCSLLATRVRWVLVVWGEVDI